jgi:hypothetical protein
MPGDRSIPTVPAHRPASQAATCPGPHPRSATGATIGLLGKAGQQGAVERLTRELIAEPGRVLLGYSVVLRRTQPCGEIGASMTKVCTAARPPDEQAPTGMAGTTHDQRHTL